MVISDQFWACSRPKGSYRGIYPGGFLERLDKLIGLKGKKVLELFGGSSNYGDTVDINPDTNPTFVADCRKKLLIKTNVYDVVIADPPYDYSVKYLVHWGGAKQETRVDIHYGKRLYNTEMVKPYSFVNEAVRICKPKGFICILHQLVYITLKKTERYAVIPITTGPNQRVRVLNIFQKK